MFNLLLSEADRQYEIILLKKSSIINSSVAYHTDLICFSFGDGCIIVSPEYYQIFMEKLSPLNFDIKCGDNTGKTYPYEIAYNAAPVGKFLFCYKKYTEKLILEQAEKRNIKVIDITQGYAKCSIVCVNENALITGDKQIYRAALDNGLESLLVTNEGVMLDGYKNGFIGGASVRIGNKLCFTGDISVHRDYEKIKEFCINHHTELIFEKGLPLYDYGSPLYLENSII